MSAKVAPETISSADFHKKAKSNTDPKKIACEVTIVVLLAITTASTIALALAVYYLDTNQMKARQMCDTDECIMTASSILSGIDQNLDPCDNFFKFTCNKWIQNNILVDRYESRLGGIGILNRKRIKEMLEQQVTPEDTEHVQKSLNLYSACLNETIQETLGVSPLLNDLKYAGGWPVLEGKSWSSNKSLTDIVIDFYDKGLHFEQLFSMEVGRDFQNSSNFILGFAEGSLTVQYRETLLDKAKVISEFRNLLADMAVIYGAENRTDAYIDLEKALDLEIWVANNSLSRDEYRNITAINNKMLLKNLSEMNNKIDWLRIVKHIMPPEFNENITENLVIRVYNPEYMKLLADKIENTDARDMKNFLGFKAALFASLQLTREAKDFYQNFRERIDGKTRLYNYVFCMDNNVDLFSFSLANMFIKNYFTESKKYEVVEMAERLRDVLKKTISTIDWMDEETRTAALNKIKATKVFIGYPEPLAEDKVVNEYYKNVEISHTRHYQNLRNLIKFSNKDHYSVLFYPRAKTDWRLHGNTFTANAFYKFSENAIDVYAGIIDGVFYGEGRPRFHTFASLGNVIGHEFTHGFDSVGAKFDENGNKRNWWRQETIEKFESRTQCFVDQYNNYTIQGIPMNGDLSLPEDIADNGGIKHAYLAYQEWKEARGEEAHLPGFEYNPDQMFWISYGSVSCAEYTKAFIHHLNKYDTHSLNEARVNIPLRNSLQFSKDFNCPAGSPMNPEKKCHVW